MKAKLSADDIEMRLNVRMPRNEYRKIKKFAFEQDMSISDVVRKALSEYVSQYSLSY
jgi:predicted HicB family RNase H-like nuclease